MYSNMKTNKYLILKPNDKERLKDIEKDFRECARLEFKNSLEDIGWH